MLGGFEVPERAVPQPTIWGGATRRFLQRYSPPPRRAQESSIRGHARATFQRYSFTRGGVDCYPIVPLCGRR
jgi:hypothetical protein